METISTQEAMAWIIYTVKAYDRMRRETLQSVLGVHNSGTRGALICTAAEQTGKMNGYKESLAILMQAGLVPDDLTEDAEEVMKL